MRHQLRLSSIAAVALLALAGIAGFLLAGTSATGATSSNATVQLRSTKLGKILVGSTGRTLYLFGKDSSGRSSCAGQCPVYWPPLLSAAKPTAGSGVNASLLGRTKRSNGKWQVTYNKHPLYYFSNDKAAGQVKGEEVNAFGANWYAVSAKGAKVTTGSGGTTTGTTPTTTYTNPGYGY
jgi:predicted lipoprotein with Yx(FWY)xxD motif